MPVTMLCLVLNLACQPSCRRRDDSIRDAHVLRESRIDAPHDDRHDDPTTAGKGKKVGLSVFDDHVQRMLRADAPNRVWAGDVREHRTSEGKRSCCANTDAFSDRILGDPISDRMTAKLAIDAVRNAVVRRGEAAGCVLHADRGSQLRSRAVGRGVRLHDAIGSTGSVGAASDTAATESFWSLLDTSVLDQRRCATRQQLRLAIMVWIERQCHCQRAPDALARSTPIDDEAKPAEPLTPAASTEPVSSSSLTHGTDGAHLGDDEAPVSVDAHQGSPSG